jgi:superfamily II DNA or RNA helicase
MNKKTQIKVDDQKISSQTKLILHNQTPVFFPYKPYEGQKEYMNSVLKMLDNNQNGLIQSPTGTGKTLCFLAASLAWLFK